MNNLIKKDNKYYVNATRYSYNGNKTYSFNGYMNSKDLELLMKKVYSNKSVWNVYIEKTPETILRMDIDL